jgi:hypothetical protein
MVALKSLKLLPAAAAARSLPPDTLDYMASQALVDCSCAAYNIRPDQTDLKGQLQLKPVFKLVVHKLKVGQATALSAHDGCCGPILCSMSSLSPQTRSVFSQLTEACQIVVEHTLQSVSADWQAGCPVSTQLGCCLRIRYLPTVCFHVAAVGVLHADPSAPVQGSCCPAVHPLYLPHGYRAPPPA